MQLFWKIQPPSLRPRSPELQPALELPLVDPRELEREPCDEEIRDKRGVATIDFYI